MYTASYQFLSLGNDCGDGGIRIVVLEGREKSERMTCVSKMPILGTDLLRLLQLFAADVDQPRGQVGERVELLPRIGRDGEVVPGGKRVTRDERENGTRASHLGNGLNFRAAQNSAS